MSEVIISPAWPDVTGKHVESPGSPATSRGRWSFLDPSSPLPTYLGIAVVAVGLALIGIAWATVAPLLDVALQLPYLVSAGFTGLALVMIGLVVISIAAKRRDAADLVRQLDRLADILTELKQTVDDSEPEP